MIDIRRQLEEKVREADLQSRRAKMLLRKATGIRYDNNAASNLKHRETLIEDAREIAAKCPPIKDEKLRAEVLESLPRFCEVVLKPIFYLPFAPMHYRLMEKTETIIREGGQDCTACPRGAGKTSVYRGGALWGCLNGFREFVILIGANQAKANKLMTGLKNILSKYQPMLDLFPEVCWPFWSLEGIIQRKLLWNGKQLTYSLKSDHIVLPDTPVEWNHSRLGNITAAGLHTALRGEEYTRPDGRTVRPDCLLIDDPQTEQSASSKTQTEDRMERLDAAITGMSGPDKRPAAMAAVTCIQDDDLACRMLKDPGWGGESFPLMPTMPQSERWAGEYFDLLCEDLRNRQGRKRVNEYYSTHRTEMDAGGSVFWEHKKKPDEVSALQGAMEIYLLKPTLFWADYQQQPAKAFESDEFELTRDWIMNRLSGLPQFTSPSTTQLLVSFVDVQESLFIYGVGAVSPGFGIDVIDYRTWPDQKRAYFTKRKATHRLEDLVIDGRSLKTLSQEERWLLALRAFTNDLLSREYQRDGGGGTDRISRLMLDCQDPDFTKVGYAFVKNSPYRTIILPSHGESIGATSKMIADRTPKEGEERGEEWIIDRHPQFRDRRIHFNPSHWKDFVRKRLTCDVAARGAMRFFGDDPKRHQVIADHILSEKPYKVVNQTTGREMVLFGKPTGENDLLDMVSGLCVCASSLKMQLDGLNEINRPKGKPRTLAEVMGGR